MLTRAHIQGYKALRDIDTNFEPMTVIVGPNGCGKTSLLEAIALVRDFVVRSHAVSGEPIVNELRSKQASSALAIELRARVKREDQERVEKLQKEHGLGAASHDSHDGVASFIEGLPSDIKKMVAGLPEPPRLASDELLVSLSHEVDGSRWELTEQSPWRLMGNLHSLETELIGTYFGHLRRFQPDPRVMSRPSYSPATIPRMSPTGKDLAEVLSWLQGEFPDRFEEIQSHLREFVPELERIRTSRARIIRRVPQDVLAGQDEQGKDVYVQRSSQREFIGSEILFDFRHARGVRAKHASEGTLLLLGLLTAVATDRLSTLLLDDADRAMHPKAQQQLVAYLRKIVGRGIQVIATTHSPYFVLHLEHEEVRIMTASAEGALLGKLTDHPEYERWRESMTPSEFWTVFGEEWLAEAKAKADGNG